MVSAMSPLLRLLGDPKELGRFSHYEWDIALRQARASGLLASLCFLAEENGQLDQLPERVQIQLSAAQQVAERHREVMRWEVAEIHRILDRIGVPVIVLKGAAYVIAELMAAKGRLFGDIDILVPHGALADVEHALGRAGWVQENQNRYDDRYYRRWMHEIPARRHAERGTVLDVHHNILPLTARNKPNPAALWEAATPVNGFSDLYVLSPEDILLHSASHLFLNGEFDRGLRDLNDFCHLARQFANSAMFWQNLVARARTLDLLNPLCYAMRYANQLLHANFPVLDRAGDQGTTNTLMNWLFMQGLQPNHTTAHNAWTATALWALYVRGHYMRMPFHLLIPHLVYKSTLAKFHEQALHNQNATKLAQFRAFIGK